MIYCRSGVRGGFFVLVIQTDCKSCRNFPIRVSFS